MTGLMNVALRRHRPQRLMMIVGLVLLLSLLLGATASAQQGPTPTYVHVYLDKEWANSQSLPPGLQNFTITGSWSAGPSGPTSTAVCQYANGALDCTYTSTLTDPNYPGGFNGIGLVVPYGLQYEISESGLPTGWQSQAGIGAFTAGFNQYCDFSYENGNSTTPDDDCLHLVVNAQTPTVAVSKTANTTYTRTYTWEIAKSVSPAVVNLFEGQQASVGYTVQVTRSAPVDSGWAVAGVISVANNSQVAVTLNSVTDAISGVGNVTVNCPVTLPASLGAGQTLVCTYTSALPNGTDRTNTATATYNTNTTATGTAPVTFGAPTTVTNAAVSVQDVYNGGAPETIGSEHRRQHDDPVHPQRGLRQQLDLRQRRGDLQPAQHRHHRRDEPERQRRDDGQLLPPVRRQDRRSGLHAALHLADRQDRDAEPDRPLRWAEQHRHLHRHAHQVQPHRRELPRLRRYHHHQPAPDRGAGCHQRDRPAGQWPQRHGELPRHDRPGGRLAGLHLHHQRSQQQRRRPTPPP
jgi:hypothetical protein